MWSDLPLFPPQASTSAEMVDALYLFMIALTAVMSTLIAGVLIAFAVRYRRQSRADRTGAVDGSIKLELVSEQVRGRHARDLHDHASDPQPSAFPAGGPDEDDLLEPIAADRRL